MFEPAGGTESFSVEANCDWSVSCPAEWVTLSVEAGDRNGTVEIAVKPTKLPRNTTITLYSNEVESRTSVIAVVQKGVVEISSVSAPVASNVVSASGTTATLSATYSGISISESDAITAGFVLTPRSGARRSKRRLPLTVPPKPSVPILRGLPKTRLTTVWHGPDSTTIRK
ncbi:MAG: BACON domain-containing protein [Alistipes finegoldii]